jgi:hypothetical protein
MQAKKQLLVKKKQLPVASRGRGLHREGRQADRQAGRQAGRQADEGKRAQSRTQTCGTKLLDAL